MVGNDKFELELEQKKARVLGKAGSTTGGGAKKLPAVKGRGSSKSNRPWSWTKVLFLACILVAIVVAVPNLLGRKGSNGGGSATNEPIEMVEVNASVSSGKITVPLNTVKENRLVRFVYERAGATPGSVEEVPVMAYISPSGTVVTAISMCEPCSSTTFFIQGNKIVCTTCGTQWDVESLKGISGGCTKYPPDRLTNTESGDVIQIQESSVANWQPRI